MLIKIKCEKDREDFTLWLGRQMCKQINALCNNHHLQRGNARGGIISGGRSESLQIAEQMKTGFGKQTQLVMFRTLGDEMGQWLPEIQAGARLCRAKLAWVRGSKVTRTCRQGRKMISSTFSKCHSGYCRDYRQEEPRTGDRSSKITI